MTRRKLEINTDRIIWLTDTARYANGKYGKVGKWNCFSLYWDGLRSASEQNGKNYKLKCYLPGIKSDLGNYTQESGKKKAEEVFKYWFLLLGD